MAVCLTSFAYAPQTSVCGNFAGAAGKFGRTFAGAGNKPFAGRSVAGYRSGLDAHILPVAAFCAAADACRRTYGRSAFAGIGFAAACFFANILIDAG